MHFMMSMSASGCPTTLILSAEAPADELRAALRWRRQGTAPLASCIVSASRRLCCNVLLLAPDADAAAAAGCLCRTLAACF